MHRGASFILLLVPTLNCFPIHTFHARRVTGEAHQRFVTRYGARTTDGGSLSSGSGVNKQNDQAKVQDILVELIELDDPSTAHSVVAPHVSLLLRCDVLRAADELEAALEASGELPKPEGPRAIAAATDFVVSWLEEFTAQTVSSAKNWGTLLKDLIRAAQSQDGGGGGANEMEYFDEFLVENTHRLSNGFLVFLADEIRRLRSEAPGAAGGGSDHALALLLLVEERVRLHLHALTEQDALWLAVALLLVVGPILNFGFAVIGGKEKVEQRCGTRYCSKACQTQAERQTKKHALTHG